MYVIQSNTIQYNTNIPYCTREKIQINKINKRQNQGTKSGLIARWQSLQIPKHLLVSCSLVSYIPMYKLVCSSMIANTFPFSLVLNLKTKEAVLGSCWKREAQVYIGRRRCGLPIIRSSTTQIEQYIYILELCFKPTVLTTGTYGYRLRSIIKGKI